MGIHPPDRKSSLPPPGSLELIRTSSLIPGCTFQPCIEIQDFSIWMLSCPLKSKGSNDERSCSYIEESKFTIKETGSASALAPVQCHVPYIRNASLNLKNQILPEMSSFLSSLCNSWSSFTSDLQDSSQRLGFSE